MPIPPFDSDGYLPIGRYQATVDEAYERFVLPYGPGHRREEIWGHWLTVNDLIRSYVDVIAAAWIGGTYTTEKTEPSDIDCVYLIHEDRIQAAAQDEHRRRGFVSIFQQGGRILQEAGLRTDVYALQWRPNPELAPRDEGDREYSRVRGQWDDFWQRRRSGAKGAPATLLDAFPRRGYVEVELDGYQA